MEALFLVIAQLWNLNHLAWLQSDRPTWEMIWKKKSYIPRWPVGVQLYHVEL